ncbi:Hypothetical predicted protein [Paramuricea clavata]|uniref:Uncharacterized protein n=1 Tax=Paramuricea clavata TaxID=317549 RepID=A0A7D9DWC7_PARCT|nr:Hypothetical predicted protein [Paramuricea clavata]
MFAIISWTAKNGISLDQEQLEVLGSGKFVVMNGGLLEPEAAVSMLYKKEMWGSIIQSVHDTKRQAEGVLNKELNDVESSHLSSVEEQQMPRKRICSLNIHAETGSSGEESEVENAGMD